MATLLSSCAVVHQSSLEGEPKRAFRSELVLGTRVSGDDDQG
jgi:hypothetical protein